MCKWVRWGDQRIDPCMRKLITELQAKNIKTLGCCCGHGKYKPTIVIDRDGEHVEMFSGVVIPRKKRFYKRDSDGVYYIPECLLGA